MTNEKYKIIKREDLSGGRIEFEIELPVETLKQFRAEAVRDISNEINIDGFRKGSAPESIVVQKVGEMMIVEKSASRAIYNVIPLVITSEKIDAITFPEITITKLAPENPVVFKLSITSMPKISLPDYKSIAKKFPQEKLEEVSDKEIDDYILYIQKQRAHAAAMAKGEKIEEDKLELPAFDNEFVKTLGDFKSVEEFKTKLKENMQEEKNTRAGETRRIKIIEGIVEAVSEDVPDVLIDQEVEKMFSKFKHDIEQFKMKPEDYLAQIKKTEEDLKKEWRPDAVKRVKMNLVLPKIAEQENLKADEKEVEHELHHLKEHDPSINENHARLYVANVLANEAVFKFLETL